MQEKLEDTGQLSCFLDVRDIRPGDDFENVIFQHLNNADELIPLLTPWSASRAWLWIEIGAAKALGKRITPVLHGLHTDDLERMKGGMGCLPRLQCTNLNHFDDVIAAIIERHPVEQDSKDVP